MNPETKALIKSILGVIFAAVMILVLACVLGWLINTYIPAVFNS